MWPRLADNLCNLKYANTVLQHIFRLPFDQITLWKACFFHNFQVTNDWYKDSMWIFLKLSINKITKPHIIFIVGRHHKFHHSLQGKGKKYIWFDTSRVQRHLQIPYDIYYKHLEWGHLPGTNLQMSTTQVEQILSIPKRFFPSYGKY